MKAILYNSENPNESLQLGETEKPTPAENEILVKVKATALNRADLLQRAGKYPPPKGASKILGLEIAGEVVEIGRNVKSHKIGDEVFGLIGGGGYAEYATIDSQMAISKPKSFSFEQAAAIPEVFLTAFQTIFWTLLGASGERLGNENENTNAGARDEGREIRNENIGNEKEGNENNNEIQQSILIHAGASGVGSAAIQLCKVSGMKVFVTASKSKHEFCKNLGADVVIDYENEDFEKVILEQTDDKGVNYIIDFIGQNYWKQNIDCIAVDGKMAILAAMSGAKLEEANLSKILIKRIQITGSTLRSRSLEYQRELTKQFSEFALPLFENQELKPIIDSIFDWSLAELAHKHMETNQNKGKIILSVSE